MSRRLAAPAKALLPRCLCDGGGVPALFRREACRYASSKSSKSPKLQPQPQSSKPAPQKNKTLPYKAQPAPLPPPKDSSSSSSTANNSEAQPISDLVRQRFMPIFGFGAAALCLGAVLASGAYHWAHDEVVRYPPGKEPQVPTGRASIQSPVEFDLHLDKSEWRLGITKLRRRLAEQAHGHVLEVAMGAGRNLEHYDWDRVTESLLASDAERNKLRLARAGWGLKGQGGAKVAELQEKGLLSFTGVDISPAMLDIAMKRMRGAVPLLAERDQLPAKPVWTLFSRHATKLASPSGNEGGGEGEAKYTLLDDRIRIIQCDAQKILPPPPPPPASPPVPQTPSSQRPLTSPSPLPPPQTPPQYYDTIVQTFGLCSVRDPVSLIANMAHLVRPGTGRIVMVEHGLSVWELVNGLLDRSARGHFERFGCWWNRDVEVIVHDAVRTVPGLEIVAFERPGWATGGTHLWIELKMTATAAAAAAPLADEENPAADHAKTDGWFGLGSFMTVKKAEEMLPSSTLSPSGGGAPGNTDAKEGENDSKQG